MILCEWDAPEGDPGQSCVHLFARILVSYRRLSAQFQFLCLLLLYSICLNGVDLPGHGIAVSNQKMDLETFRD